MIERPILFSGPMVRAILDGRKTMTRRIIKPQPPDRPAGMRPHKMHIGSDDEGIEWWVNSQSANTGGWFARSPYGGPPTKYGPVSRLWVRETWRVGAWDEDEGKVAVDYRADDSARREWLDPKPDDDGELFNRLWEQSCEDCAGRVRPDDEGRYHWKPGDSPCRWRSPRFMPRTLSRITLEVTGVRVERLQEISAADCRAEGIDLQGARIVNQPSANAVLKRNYEALWDTINAKRSPWASNPWVWVIEFKRLP